VKNKTLLALVDKLKACPAHNPSLSKESLLETWKCFRQIDLEHGDELTPAIMAALILYDEEQFGELLNEVERSQVFALAKVALERYKKITNPPNKLGKLIAGIINQEPK
jgi:hypothetical protein